MKIAPIIVVSAGLLFLGAVMIPLVGFHYPNVIQDQPLEHPQKVLRIEGTNLVMENGAMIAVENLNPVTISNKLRQSSWEIDIEGTNVDVLILARQNGWVCGTPWAQPIRIPLFRDDVYKNRRQPIGMGAYLDKSSNDNQTK